MPQRIARQIYKEVEQAKKILLVPHQNPDGDALGSISSFVYYLRRLNKPHTVFCLTDSSAKLHSLPHIVEFSSDESVWDDASYDLIIVLDSGDLKYAGIKKFVEKLEHDPTIINIDHHPTNTYFGHCNLIMDKASSTAEILYKFYRHNNIEIDKNMAASLLTGLITDTENFTNPGTSRDSLKIASDLIKKGANFNLIKSWFLRDKSISSLKLWGIVLSRLKKHEEHEIVYTYVTLKDLAENEADESESEGIANFMNNLGDGKASLILKEKDDGSIKGSFRTTRDDFDVAQIAQALGGGGHKKASGFSLEANSIDEALEKIWEAIKTLG
ncbi:MAG TPA: hypothetical protein DEB09_01980 [Candidatus Magasanikbacteria bacterium]|nr:hypothetical protein [Candidatus Magasanikbacteria bacterium]